MPMAGADGQSRGISRRRFLGHGVAAVVGGVVAASVATPAAGQSNGFDSWFDNVSNYDGIVDRTGEPRVTIAVGAEGNGGNLAFDPPAIRVDPGTTVVWEWTGDGGGHNVVAQDGTFDSGDLVSESGYEFENAFEENGIYRYVCEPHEAAGMKGAVVVGDVSIGDGSGGDGTGASSDSAIALLQKAADEHPLVVVIYTILGFAGIVALLPEFIAAPRVVGNAFRRAGYRVKRPVLFRRRPLGSMLVGWATFFVILAVLGAVVVGAWYVTGGGPMFLVAALVLALSLAVYVSSQADIPIISRPTPGNGGSSQRTGGGRPLFRAPSHGSPRTPGSKTLRTLQVVRGWIGVGLLFVAGGAVIIGLWHATGGGAIFLAGLAVVALVLAGYVVTSSR